VDDCRRIENLIYTYAERLDAGDLEGTARLFANAEIVAPAEESVVRGYEEVLAMFRNATRIYADTGTPRTRHITTNVIVEPRGDEAAARSSFTVVQGTADFPLQPIVVGRYRDRFRRTPAGWEFARREMHVDLAGDLSAHLLIDL